MQALKQSKPSLDITVLPDALLPYPNRDPKVTKVSDRQTGQGLPSPISPVEKWMGQWPHIHSTEMTKDKQPAS